MNTRHLMLLAGLGLVACTKPVDTPRPEFGEAVRNNNDLQAAAHRLRAVKEGD